MKVIHKTPELPKVTRQSPVMLAIASITGVKNKINFWTLLWFEAQLD